MQFGSDNWAGAATAVIDAIVRANQGSAPAYGNDDLSARVRGRFADIFEAEVSVHFVATGGAANGLALAALSPSYGMILCHEESHVQMDECGGPEFFTGGAKLLPVKGEHGKLDPETIAATLAGFPERAPHGAPARALSITEATECGTIYSPEEIAALSATARRRGLRVHMDGARFANAVAATGATPADLTWKAGVDVMSFGGTKNGCLAAEAVVFFDLALAGDVELRRKRAGHLLSKMRFIAAQFEAYLENGLWLDLAARANATAKRLAGGLASIDGCRIWHPTQTNEVFVSLPKDSVARLKDAGAVFYPWITPSDPAGGTMHRLICSWQTTHQEVDRFIALARSGSNG
jgi:threonine aldolase